MGEGNAEPSPAGTIETPVGIVDVATVRANSERAVAYCARHALAWRPHVKTHKSLDVARIQLDAGARGVTVATPREAEVMSRLTDDVLLAYPPVGEARLARLLELPGSVDLKVALDSSAALEALALAARAAGRSVGVLVELDVGMARVGLGSADAVVGLAGRATEMEGVDYRGILFYPGHIRSPVDEQEEAVRELSGTVHRVYDALAAVGLAPAIVSGGSTPTLWRSHEVEHLTEVRAGTWIFNDRDSLAMGVASVDDLAYAVLATVVSTAVDGQAVVDAGSKALAKEERGGGGYGIVVDHPDVRVVRLSEEHGVLDLTGTEWRPRVGDRVRILPNHVCVSVNLQDRLLAMEEGSASVWPLEARGRERPS